MRKNKIIENIEANQIKHDYPDFSAGDTVLVQVRVRRATESGSKHTRE